MAKEKKPKFTTPVGVGFHPYLDKPDTKFKDEGEFKVKLRLSAEDAKAIKAQVDKEMKEVARKQEKLLEAKKKNKGKAIPENTPYKDAVDDNGDETGEIEFSFGTAASGKSKKDGKVWHRKIKFFDAKGKAMKPVSCWSGTELRVSYEIGSYFINIKVGYGVKLYLVAVKIIKLVQGGDGGSADDYGFGEEEEGYSSGDMTSDESDDSSSDDAEDNEDNSEGDDSGDDEDTDF